MDALADIDIEALEASGEVVVDMTTAPTVYSAMMDDVSTIVGLMGPFGSGKSVGMATRVMRWSLLQEPAADGIRYTRHAIIRNTSPELKATTIKTMQATFPEGRHGRVVYSSPITYHIRIPKTGSEPGIDAELMFIPLDKPKDVRRLLSLDLTCCWVNEAREVPRPIIDALTGRVGRYPSRERGRPSCIQIILDTNPPDDDHWWFEMFEGEQAPVVLELPDGERLELSFKLYQQPPAMLEVENIGEERFRSIEAGYTDMTYKRVEVVPGLHGRHYALNPSAENLPNLSPGYYHRIAMGKDHDFVQVYCQGRYGYVQEGRPVVPEYSDEMMSGEFPLLPDRPVWAGVDIGGGTLQPAAAFFQRSERGTYFVHSEVVATSMGVNRFAQVLKQHVHEMYPGMNVEALGVDPAAEKRDEVFETKITEHLRAQGFVVRTAPTQDVAVRRLAIAQPCGRFIDGRPGLMIHKRCRMLRKGLRGAWVFRKLQVVGSERYAEKPEKSEYSHPCEALGYGLLIAGEQHVETAVSTHGKWSKPFAIKQDFGRLH